MLVDVLAQLDVILIAIMLSGTIVKMGRGSGKIAGDTHFRKFYVLFLGFILENIAITLIAEYGLLPFIESVIFNNYFQVLAITAELVLVCNMWFAWTFGYKQRIEIIVLTIFSTIVLIALFVSNPPTMPSLVMRS
jgi:hypothetical protein